MEGLFDGAARERIVQATPRPLRIAELQVGDAGQLQAEVRMVAPVRKYNRKRGGEGVVGRVTLADGTGEIDLVLWDDEVRLAQTGPLQPGALVRIHGPTVKAGYRGGLELGLGSAEVVALPKATARGTVEGVLLSIGDVQPFGAPPATRFRCDLVVRTGSGEARVVAWDGLVKQARAAGTGTTVLLSDLAPNPFLSGWWVADPKEGATLSLAATPK